jgi:competence protein ComEA
MMTRVGLVAGALLLAAIALWHPAPHPAFQTVATAAFPASAPSATPGRRGRSARGLPDPADTVVYVAGAVRRPGLYRVRPGQRAADAIAAAGGLRENADGAGVNLAARAADGSEIYVPVAGETASRSRRASGSSAYRRRGASRSRLRGAIAALAPESVDVNAADAQALGDVPGIGRAIAARIVDVRDRDGTFTSLDELLDVAGMTQARLERARPFLRPVP